MILPINNPLIRRYSELGCECKNSIIPKKSLRINSLKISEEELVKRLTNLNVKLEKIHYLNDGYFYEADFSLSSTTEYLQGYFYIQESASQLPALSLNPLPNELVLDMCASPGSKTTQIAQLMKNTGTIIAIDIDSRRLMSLRNNLERCGIINTLVIKKDSRFIFDLGMQFDKILLDAPCSGNYAIEEEFFQKKSIPGIQERSRIQKELLKAAEKSLKKDGIIIYSTCSLEPEENELNINWFLKKFPNMTLEDTGLSIGDEGLTTIFKEKLDKRISLCKRLWPEKTKTQGFFIAKLRKIK